jgi:hypothetical protein
MKTAQVLSHIMVLSVGKGRRSRSGHFDAGPRTWVLTPQQNNEAASVPLIFAWTVYYEHRRKCARVFLLGNSTMMVNF